MLRELSRVLGYERVGPRIREVLDTDILTAVRRGILVRNKEGLCLSTRTIADYDRDELKKQFLASLGGPVWTERGDAIRNFARWLGFRRTGAAIDEFARSIIRGLLHENKLESDPKKGIRRV